MSRCALVKYLRELLVHEWLVYQVEYQPFFNGIISEEDYETEANRYLESGIFCSAFGDAMLYGLSSVM